MKLVPSASSIKVCLLLGALCLLVAVFLLFRPVGVRESCVARAPQLERANVGYELIDLVRKEVWLTVEFTPGEFAEFSAPLLWIKNQPREGVSDGGRFLRSPGCSQPGQFTYLHAFGKEFLNVVRLKEMNKSADVDGLIRETILEKYHIMTYIAGRTVSILQNPSGEQFILVSRDAYRTSDTFALPEGWSIDEYELTEDLEVDLSGRVSVLRTENEDSYQGPLPSNLDF